MRTPLQLLKEDLQFFLDRDFSYHGEEVRITFESHGEAVAAANKARKAAVALIAVLDAGQEAAPQQEDAPAPCDHKWISRPDNTSYCGLCSATVPF